MMMMSYVFPDKKLNRSLKTSAIGWTIRSAKSTIRNETPLLELLLEDLDYLDLLKKLKRDENRKFFLELNRVGNA